MAGAAKGQGDDSPTHLPTELVPKMGKSLHMDAAFQPEEKEKKKKQGKEGHCFRGSRA